MTLKAEIFLLPAYRHWVGSLPKKKNLWLYQFSHDTYSAMSRFLATEKKRKAVLLFSEQKATCLLKKPDTAA
jgi:hypothetical protein